MGKAEKADSALGSIIAEKSSAVLTCQAVFFWENVDA